MLPPNMMCNKHLLGEHGELHKFLPSWKKKQSISGRLNPIVQMEPLSYKYRHDEIVEEMLIRGMKHKSPLKQPDFDYLSRHEIFATVDMLYNLIDLASRCDDCWKKMKGGILQNGQKRK